MKILALIGIGAGITVGVLMARALVWKREPEPFDEPGGGW
jgi:hypothetical protein